MPGETPRQMRDGAIPALPCLTGIRGGALTPPGIGHVELDERSVTQNPRGVATRFGGRIDTFFARDPVARVDDLSRRGRALQPRRSAFSRYGPYGKVRPGVHGPRFHPRASESRRTRSRDRQRRLRGRRFAHPRTARLSAYAGPTRGEEWRYGGPGSPPAPRILATPTR